MQKIEILDKINNTYKKVDRDEDMKVIHPLNKKTIFLKDMELKGEEITGVIFKEDGTTLILYCHKKIREGELSRSYNKTKLEKN